MLQLASNKYLYPNRAWPRALVGAPMPPCPKEGDTSCKSYLEPASPSYHWCLLDRASYRSAVEDKPRQSSRQIRGCLVAGREIHGRVLLHRPKGWAPWGSPQQRCVRIRPHMRSSKRARSGTIFFVRMQRREEGAEGPSGQRWQCVD